MDEARAEALSERIFTEMVGGMGLLALYLGHRLALFKELAKSGPTTVSQLAQRTKLSESTVRNYARKAGYRNASVLEIDNPFYRFYRLTP